MSIRFQLSRDLSTVAKSLVQKRKVTPSHVGIRQQQAVVDEDHTFFNGMLFGHFGIFWPYPPMAVVERSKPPDGKIRCQPLWVGFKPQAIVELNEVESIKGFWNCEPLLVKVTDFAFSNPNGCGKS
ncbi:MAG: hypothetical protein VB099_04345 [Candidatus Limiplasma sp.]|nr:hypothetical protein [Candidatus Limiplasma sp.]